MDVSLGRKGRFLCLNELNVPGIALQGGLRVACSRRAGVEMKPLRYGRVAAGSQARQLAQITPF